MRKQKKIALLVISAAIIFSVVTFGYGVYKENEGISKYCVKVSVSSLKDSGKFISVDICEEWVKKAGGVEKFKELAKQVYEKD